MSLPKVRELGCKCFFPRLVKRKTLASSTGVRGYLRILGDGATVAVATSSRPGLAPWEHFCHQKALQQLPVFLLLNCRFLDCCCICFKQLVFGCPGPSKQACTRYLQIVYYPYYRITKLWNTQVKTKHWTCI